MLEGVGDTTLFPRLDYPDDATAIRVDERALTYRELASAAAALQESLSSVGRVALWATPELETCVAAVAALTCGATLIPINPKAGSRELEHIVSDSAPELVLALGDVALPGPLADIRHHALELETQRDLGGLVETTAERPAIVLYTSGTTGRPKGVMIPRRAIVANLDALAAIWSWTERDVLAHALPLFHVHGLVLGVIGPLRRGGQVEVIPRFSPAALAEAIGRGATMVFGVPTMYRRIAEEAERDASLGATLGRARLLVSGSAALPAAEHVRIERLTGLQVVERYGMTETLMNLAVRDDEPRRPGFVGRPLPGVDVRIVDDLGNPFETADDETIGEIEVRGPNLFSGYLNRPDATAEAFRDGWFRTGDLATRASDGYVRIVGRRATDLIKSGGYKIGAGEIESALLEHPRVSEAAVAGLPDADLGERVVAWIVPADGEALTEAELVAHVSALLSPHKRPREVRFVAELPRNALGKVMKKALTDGAGPTES